MKIKLKTRIKTKIKIRTRTRRPTAPVSSHHRTSGQQEELRSTSLKKTVMGLVIALVGFGVFYSVLWMYGFPVQEFAASRFLNSPDENVITAGGQYLRGYIFDCFFAGIHFCFSGYFCACGLPMFSFVSNITGVALVRVPGAYFMSKMFPSTLLPMGLATAAGSLLQAVICVIAYGIIGRRDIFGGCINCILCIYFFKISEISEFHDDL